MSAPPYARLREVIRQAEAGRNFNEPIGRRPVKILPLEPRSKPRSKAPQSYGALIAATLTNEAEPFESQIPVTNTTRQELHTAQTSGTRWLKYNGWSEFRLSYRRTVDGAVWFLTAKDASWPAGSWCA